MDLVELMIAIADDVIQERADARYLAEVQRSSDTLSREGTAAAVVAWLASWDGEQGRSVAVYRVEADGDHALVELRRTLARGLAGGTAPVLRADGVEPDATWQEALKKNDIASRVAP